MSANAYSMPNALPPELRLMRRGFRVFGAVVPDLTSRLAVRLFLTPRRRPYSKKAARIFEQGRAVDVRFGSRELAATVWGDAGPTVMLVHGWESNASVMRGFVRPLLRQGCRVVAFDAPAHGRSEGRQTNVVDYGGAIRAVAQQLGPVDAIVGHSFGAAATLLMLGRMPEPNVRRVVSLAAPSRLTDLLGVWTRTLAVPDGVKIQMQRHLEDRVGMSLHDLTAEAAVATLRVPGLVVHDRDDHIVPYQNGVAIQAAWPSAELMTTTGLDHRGLLGDPSVIKRVVGFVTAEMVDQPA